LTPSMASISRPIRPCASQMSSTCLNTWPIRSPRPEMKSAMVVKCGPLSPLRAMKCRVRAGAFDGAAGDDAARIGQQHDLEHHGRGIGARAALIVVEACIEVAQVDLLVQQVVQRVLEGTRQQLRLQIHSKETRARVDVLLAGHRGAEANAVLSTLQRPCQRGRLARWFFYSLVRAHLHGHRCRMDY